MQIATALLAQGKKLKLGLVMDMENAAWTKICPIMEIARVIKGGKVLPVKYQLAQIIVATVVNVYLVNVFARKDGKDKVAIKWIVKTCVRGMVPAKLRTRHCSCPILRTHLCRVEINRLLMGYSVNAIKDGAGPKATVDGT
jgi:acyl-CoA hydrolase